MREDENIFIGYFQQRPHIFPVENPNLDPGSLSAGLFWIRDDKIFSFESSPTSKNSLIRERLLLTSTHP